MSRLIFMFALILTPVITAAQEVKGPQVTQLFVEVFPANNSPVGTITSTTYGFKVLEVGRLRITASGFVDLEPAADRKLYYMNHGQVIKYGAIPVGAMFEEAAGRPNDPGKPIKRFGRYGATTNFNDLPGIRRLTKPVFAVLNVSWLLAATSNIQDEIKVSLVTKDVPVRIGWLNAEGFYRVRYGSARNFGQPQVNFRPRGTPWLKFVVEAEMNGHQLDLYYGARVTLVKK